jgi:pyridoxamine 5'-phosphate oxidase
LARDDKARDDKARDGVMIRDRRVQYETAGLDLGDLNADPILQWQLWHDQALEAGVAEPNSVVLSTVDSDGVPDARNLLIRGADAAGFSFFTNYLSTKSRQLQHNPVAAATSSWLDLHRQVRIRGEVTRLSDVQSDDYFQSRPRESQLGAWASPQSEPLSDRSELDRLLDAVRARFEGIEVPRPPHWGGWLLIPIEVEFWQGRPSRLHDRFQYRRGEGGIWTITRLAP